tara:strand:+ start:1906 stop:2358 length:453 start_codon:yes stop_codon:yes gene_type:complete
MNKLFKFIILILILQACSYEPIYLNKNYNFQFSNINLLGDEQINKKIKNFLIYNANGDKSYGINLKTSKRREIVTSDSKGDPKIYKIIINLKYQIYQNEKEIKQDQIYKQVTYKSIKDKFELSQYENNILKNLSDNISKEILLAVKILSQ